MDIPFRFVPAIPISWGYIYVFILELDGRDRLGLVLSSSAREFLVRRALPKGIAGQLAPPMARTWDRLPFLDARSCQKRTRLKPVGVGGKQRSGVRHDASRSSLRSVAGNLSAAYIKRDFRKASGVDKIEN